jgi:hypothetical protein
MRDPGRPRRNPFFEHDALADGAGMGFRDAEPDPPTEDPTAAAGGLGALLALVGGLADAQPEAAEHLVAAAHEVVLSVKVLVDATEAVLAEQRTAMAARREAERAAAPHDGGGGPGDAADASVSSLRSASAP